MKRLTFSCAFLLALVASVTAWSLCAFLIALISGSISSSLVNALTPALPIPTLSTEASMLVTNTELHVSFRHPEGWTLIDSGMKHIPNPLQSATYGLKGQPHFPTFTITRQDVGTPILQDDLVRSEVEAFQHRGAHIIEELRETIQGLPAGGVRYIRGREVGFDLFISQPGQTHTFEWTSDVEYSDELEQIYRNMFPTIRIEPPPP